MSYSRSSPTIISAFVGRSFLDKDEIVWQEVRKILESLMPLGFGFEDAKEAQLRPISDKVRQGIERNDFYIGILTRRVPTVNEQSSSYLLSRIVGLKPLQSPFKWTTSNWVIQESGFALGKGKKVLFLIEQGVDFPSADLDADTEWIPFERNAISQCSNRLVAMIGRLISEALPTVLPSSEVLPPPETTAEQAENERTGPILGNVIELLRTEDFQKADEEFEKFMAVEPFRSDEDWRYFYLRLKSVKGHDPSLQQLKSVVKLDPQNMGARRQLAYFYRHFNDHKQAAKVLLEGADVASPDSKRSLTEAAAEELAKDGQPKEAYNLIRELISSLPDPTELAATYLCLAAVAKSQSDRELESAALERALELNPSDSGTRFRIAYLYGEMENRRLAVYHYTLRLAQGPDSTALNNLGVSYRGLQLPGKEIAAFEKASEEDLLPKANLSHAYVDRGFLVKGEELANQVLHSNPEQIARERAVAVLDRISQIRLDEEQTLETIMNESKSERIFRSAYSFAFVDSLRNPIQGEFQTPHGKFVLKQESDELIGEGSYEEKQSSGLPLIFPGNRQANEIIKVTTLKFVAKIAGRSGTYKLHKKEVLKDNSWDVPKTETFQGLLVINEDGRSFDVLERNEKRFKCYTATKSYP